jgi:hypothetical protein
MSSVEVRERGSRDWCRKRKYDNRRQWCFKQVATGDYAAGAYQTETTDLTPMCLTLYSLLAAKVCRYNLSWLQQHVVHLYASR